PEGGVQTDAASQAAAHYVGGSGDRVAGFISPAATTTRLMSTRSVFWTWQAPARAISMTTRIRSHDSDICQAAQTEDYHEGVLERRPETGLSPDRCTAFGASDRVRRASQYSKAASSSDCESASKTPTGRDSPLR